MIKKNWLSLSNTIVQINHRTGSIFLEGVCYFMRVKSDKIVFTSGFSLSHTRKCEWINVKKMYSLTIFFFFFFCQSSRRTLLVQWGNASLKVNHYEKGFYIFAYHTRIQDGANFVSMTGLKKNYWKFKKNTPTSSKERFYHHFLDYWIR